MKEAYAAIEMNIKGVLRIFKRAISLSGIGSYMIDDTVIS